MLGENASMPNAEAVQTVRNTGVPAMTIPKDKREESQKSGEVTWGES